MTKEKHPKPNRPLFQKSELRFFLLLAGILILFLGVSFFFAERRVAQKAPDTAALIGQAFSGVDIQAKAAYVLDVRSGRVLYQKNPDDRVPLASVTKIMTALVASEIAPNTTTITIYPEALLTEGDSGLLANERFVMKDLVNFSLTSSSNDGMTAIAMNLGAPTQSAATPSERLSDFIAQMNREADKLGMKDSYYNDVTGLDLSTTKAGAYGSAKDMATLFAYVLKENPDILEATENRVFSVRSLDGVIHNAENTDEIVGKIPGILGSKTGSTDLAGGNLVVAFDPELGRPIVIAVLGSTNDARFTDVSKLVARTMTTLSIPVELEK